MRLPLLEVVGAQVARCKGGFRFGLTIPKFVVYPGEFVVLFGPNGCGKSTSLDLLAMIMKMDRVESFKLTTRGGETLDMRTRSASSKASIRRRHFGYVMQSGGLLPFLSIKWNIALPAILGGAGNVVRNGRLGELASVLGIAEHLRKKPHQVSGGQRQRAAVARSLIHRPTLVLADEPTASVDRPAAASIMAMFKQVCLAEGASVVVVTHDASLVRGLADRCYGFKVEGCGTSGAEAVCEETNL